LPVVYYVLPETKDVALEMVQNYFKKEKTVFYIDVETTVPKNEQKS